MGKKITTNPKSIEARQRKEEKKRVEQEKKEKEKEDALWTDDDKLVNRKMNRKEEKERKKQEELIKKKENKQLYEEELNSIKAAKSNVPKVVTRAQIERTLEKERLEREKLEKAKLNEAKIDEIPLVENLNRLEPDLVVASGIDSAIEALSINENEKVDKHPEKRMKAAFTAFEEAQLPILKKQNPSLRLSQLKQILKKQWDKHPENPLNQAFKAYNAK